MNDKWTIWRRPATKVVLFKPYLSENQQRSKL
jgi:hypothetical protein